LLKQKLSTYAVRFLLLFCVAFACAGLLRAQHPGSAASGGRVTPDRVQPERPSRAAAIATASPSPSPEECDPATVKGTCPGTYSFVYGFNASASPRHGGAQTEKAGFAFLAYFTRRTFFEVDNDNVISTKAPAANRITGFGDTTVYLGADVVLEGKRRPAISFEYGIKAPTASSKKNIGSGLVDHTVIGAISKFFRDNRTYLEFDGGDYIARVKSDGFDHFPFASAFLNQKLGQTNRFKLHLEVGGDFATSKSNADMYSLNYLETRLSRKDSQTYVGFRTGANFGLTPNISRAGLYVAIKVGGNLKNVFR
jgi:hypothetical protein